MASSSSSSNSFPSPDPSSSESCAYDVLLSFRGEDTRKGFVDHLYTALDRSGFRTFKDDERLRAGELISHKLLEAIQQSGSAVVIFSKNYASSSWCLDELVKIMEYCKDQRLRRRLAVFPVFYDVDPSEVRRQNGTFWEGFAKAAGRNADKADVWRKALHGAANLSGYDLRNTADGLESECIKTVVEWCNSTHSCNKSAIDENLIGMQSRVNNLMLLLRRDLEDVRMIGIWGMGGAGKTTVAKVTFHQIKKQFDGASFIADIREKSKRIDGLQLLQKKILSDILMDKNLEIDGVDEGVEMIKKRLGQKKVLIILDDVDDDEQLRALAKDRDWFGKGSRVLITTRDQHVLVAHGVDKNDIHSVNLLSEEEAILLFNRHAFKKCTPTKEYNELSLRVVHYAAGLPLALRVLGSFLCGRGMAEWTSTLERLEKTPEEDILKKLQISYDDLKQVEKEIFLDIAACFFKGWGKDEVIRILDSCEFDPVIGIDVLVQKSLISLSNGRFQMHDLLQELGRNIGRQNRLWRYEDIKNILRNNKGIEAIEAIVAGPEVPLKCEITKAFGSMKKLRILHLTSWGKYEVPLKCDITKPFRSMKKLIRILCLNYRCVLFNKHEYLPNNELRWVTWERYPHESLPESFHAPKLVGLEMHASNIVQLWKGNELLDKLKFLDLSYSRRLIRSPDFSGIPNLETLKLNCCSNLIEVHRSIGDLQRLVSLDFSYCENLAKFPSNILMKSLEILNFTGCWKFKRFPELLGNMDRLSELHLAETAIKVLPLSIANLTKLVLIDLRGCVNLLDLPDTICLLKYLKKMNLSVCWKLTKLPENLGFIESLEELDVSRSAVKVLPSSIVLLKNLRCLYGCMILVDSISHIESCLKVLVFDNCDLPDRATPVDICKLSFLEKLDLQMNPFSFVPFIISQLSHLKILDLTWCRELKELPELPSSIAILEADHCTSLESIEGLSGKYEWLWMVTLKGCSSLRMREKCDQCQEYSITGGGSEWMTLTPSELDFCQKHRKSPRVSAGDILLQSMLQRHAIVNHRFSICYTEGVDNAIPEWFRQAVIGNRFILKLPPNWYNKITGFAMCVVFDGPFSKINLGISLSEVGWQIPGLDDDQFARPDSARSSSSTAGLFPKLAGSPAADRDYDVWIGYISLKMLQRSTESVMLWTEWMDAATTQLFLTFKTDLRGRYDSDIPIESCAARAVYMEDWEASTAASSSFSSSSSLQQQQHDPNFAAKTTLPCSKVPGTTSRVTLSLETTTHTVISCLESQCIKKVVEWCNSSHSWNISAIDEDLIGMPSRVRNIMLLLRRDLDDVRMIGIWGMGGAGKTTLARVAFHQFKKQFDGASFIADAREKSKRIDGLQLLQKKILSDILMDKSLEVDSVYEGIDLIKRRLGDKKVLIILDDVDDDEQLCALAGDRKWFGNGSRVLITTRDRHLLMTHGVDKNDIHSVDLLSEDEATLLFNRHAFKNCGPTKEFNELSLRVVRYAAGLPLALRVLGSFLCGRGMAEWTSALKRLEKIPQGKILEKLQISYDGLEQVEKEIFLDIACFFKGWEKDEVIRILDSCDFDPVIGIDVLVKKSLISLSDDEIFQMHDLLEEMGRSIGRQNRLWHREDIHNVQRNNKGTEAVEAIVSEWNYPCDSKVFMSMKKLRLLHLCTFEVHTTFVGPGYLPNELQWLSWYCYPHESLAESFQAPKLVGLEMQYSSIVHLWKGKKLLDKLKFLNLRCSKKLIKTPDFSGIPNLKELNLSDCKSLIEVHPSIGDLQRLVSLDLGSCSNLVDFPSNIRMKSLETLNFNGCEEFKRFPEIRGEMDRLSKLSMEKTAIEGLPSSIANLTKLVSIHLTGCEELLYLPDTICELKNLKTMDLCGCWKLRKLPENLGHIESLEELLVDGSGVKVLPSSIEDLKNLTHVSLSGCCELILEESMTRIGSCLKILDLCDCKLSVHHHQAAIPIDVGHLSSLEELDLSFNPFAFFPINISQLSRLKILNLSECKQLKALPELPSSIAILVADGCTSLECIVSLSAGKHKWLWSVSLQRCESLRMHEKCDEQLLYYCHEQDNSTSITGPQPKRIKLDHLCDRKHCKKLPNLLQSMLQGHAVVNHRVSICYSEGLGSSLRSVDCTTAIPKWFGQEVMKGNRFVLKLPPNWQNTITGFTMCVAFHGPFLGISLGIISLSEVGWEIPAAAGHEHDIAEFAPGPAADRDDDGVWIGYISLKMLQRSTESVMPTGWVDAATTQLLLTFENVDDHDDDDDDHGWIEWCAGRVVCMDELVENSEALSSSFFTCSSSSSSLQQQQHDPNFATDQTTLPCYKDPETANGITLVLLT